MEEKRELWTVFFEGPDGIRGLREFRVDLRARMEPWAQIAGALPKGSEILLTFPGSAPRGISYASSSQRMRDRDASERVDVYELPVDV